MATNNSWLGRQIRSYVNAGLPSWQNLPNNPSAKNGMVSTSEKPALLTNYITVSADCIVQEAGYADPFTVKTLR